jgi:hypothetical protein
VSVSRIVADALRATWHSRALWVFGVFIAGTATGGRSPYHPSRAASVEAHPLQLLLVAAVLLVAVCCVGLHVISEAAVVEGVHRARRGRSLAALEGFSFGRSRLGPVLRLKLLAFLALAGVVAILGAPILLAALVGFSFKYAAAVSAVCGIVALPWLLSGYFVYVYALRFAVIDGVDARQAIGRARGFLSGRIQQSLQLLIIAFLGQAAGGICVILALTPGLGVGFVVSYATSSATAGFLAGALLSVAPVVAIVGATGTFRSAVWTIGFLESRAMESA